MGIHIERISKSSLIFFSMAAMLVGLFVSRAFLSIAMVFFLVSTCAHANIGTQIKNCFTSPLLISITLLFFIPFISGLWSHDLAEWLDHVRIKLPLLLLPVAFAGQWQLSPRQWRKIAGLFLLLLFAGCCWSLARYVVDLNFINEQYLKAKVIPTLLENDHVRFSWLVAIAVVLCFYWLQQAKQKLRWLLVFLIIFFTVYLHIIAARTGLFCHYIFFGLYVVYTIKKLEPRTLVFTASLLLLLPAAAWFFFPTFQNRIRYNLYDLSFIRQQQYLPGGNDGNRMLSIKAGWQILEDHPFGVGIGDVKTETYRWYNENVPGMLTTDKLYPSSEWLMYGAAAGWIGVLGFTGVMLVPFFIRLRKHFFWLTINLLAALSFLFDIGLEVQFGVFIYVFLVLWWWKWIQPEQKMITEE